MLKLLKHHKIVFFPTLHIKYLEVIILDFLTQGHGYDVNPHYALFLTFFIQGGLSLFLRYYIQRDFCWLQVHRVAITLSLSHREHRMGDLVLSVSMSKPLLIFLMNIWSVFCGQRDSTWNVLQVTVCGVAEAVLFVLYGGTLRWQSVHKHPPPPAVSNTADPCHLHKFEMCTYIWNVSSEENLPKWIEKVRDESKSICMWDCFHSSRKIWL